MRGRGALLCVGITCGVSFHVRSHAAMAASGQAAPLESLEWNAPATCPSRSEIISRVRSRLGFSLEDRDLLLGLSVRKGRDGWEMRVEEDTGPARVLRGVDCEELADVAVFLVSVRLEAEVNAKQEGGVATEDRTSSSSTAPDAVQPTNAKSEGNGSEEQLEPSVESVDNRSSGPVTSNTTTPSPENMRSELSTPSERVKPARRRMRRDPSPWTLDTGAALGGRWREDLTEGRLELGIRTQWRWAALGFTAGYGRMLVLEGEPGPWRLRMSTVDAAIRACAGPRSARLSLPLCVGAQAGLLLARPMDGVTSATQGRSPQVSLTAALRPSIHLVKDLYLYLRPEFEWLAVRPNFRLNGVGRVCCSASWQVGAVGGLEWRWGSMIRRRSTNSPQSEQP